VVGAAAVVVVSMVKDFMDNQYSSVYAIFHAYVKGEEGDIVSWVERG
jgi:hypothetical protein